MPLQGKYSDCPVGTVSTRVKGASLWVHAKDASLVVDTRDQVLVDGETLEFACAVQCLGDLDVG